MTSANSDTGKILQEQTKHLLLAKLHIPSIRANQVFRPRLLDLLNAAGDKKLILVSAPAGYGKTALVSTWLREAKARCAWLSLDSADNDPVRFLQYLISAVQTAIPGVEEDLVHALKSAEPGKYGNVVDLLANDLASVPGQLVVVLDDFHVISNELVVNVVLHLVEHLPDRKQLVLATRIDPPLPLARMRVRDQLADIRSDQLRFTRHEVGAFLNDIMGLTLSASDLAAMETRTEGWVAGLQMAGLSMQRHPDVHSFVSAFSGSHHYVMDYLVEEVLKLQSRKATDFLLRTSVLDQMCAPLCDALVDVGLEGALDGQAMLEALEASNLFVVPLDDERRWYRYHHLFSDVLRKRLEFQFPRLPTELRRRASRWYEQNGLTSEAIRQAILAKDSDRATQLIEDNGCSLMISGEVATLIDWIDAIDFKSEIHPWLAVQKAWALALTGNTDLVEPAIQIPEHLLATLAPTPEVRTLQGTMAAARAYCANSRRDTESAAKHARHALDTLPGDSPISQTISSVATSILGDASWITGNLDEATRAYDEAVRIGRDAGNTHMVIIASCNLADVLTEQGQLSRAADIYNKCLQMAVRPDGQRSPLAAGAYAGLARLSYEHNRLDEASQSIRLCIDLCRQWGDLGLQAVACAILARLEHVRGDEEGATKTVRNAEQLAGSHALSPQRTVLIASRLALVWLARGDMEKVSRFVRNGDLRVDIEIPYRRESEYVVLSRFLLARGDYDASLDLSKRLLLSAERSNRVGQVIEVLVVQALGFQARREPDKALGALGKALSLAKPEGYVRTFIDEGAPMARLLHLARSRQIETEYVTELLSAIEGAGATKPPPKPMGDPLTERELEVLELIAAGYPNQKIADKLVISIATVKRHISNIYTKLDVDSRTQAVAVAKELNLFE